MLDLTPRSIPVVPFREKIQLASEAEEFPASRLPGFALPDDVQQAYNLSSNVLVSNDPQVGSSSGSLVKIKEITCSSNMAQTTLRIYFETAHSSGSSYVTNARIYKNGSAFGTNRQVTGADLTWHDFTEDLSFTAGDLIQIYVQTLDINFQVLIRNFRILGTIVVPKYEWSNTLT